jgi:dTDP-glucose 4,6-dehydratase/UDP-glucose 4-epimerase
MSLASTYANCRVLVTGGLGFIGSNLARRLVSMGAKVTIVDALTAYGGGNVENIIDIKAKVQVEHVDIRDTHAMGSLLHGQQFLFNLAAQSGHVESMLDPETDLEINVRAQVGILEACRRVCPSVRVVFTSTRQVYGRPDRLPVDEAHPIRPVDVNGINKFAAECYHLLYHGVHGIQSVVLRLTNTFGPGMRIIDGRQMFLGLWIRRVLEEGMIQIYGDGSQRRDLMFVDDCVEALLRAGADSRAAGRVYNVGAAESIRLDELAQRLLSAGSSLGLHAKMECVPFPPDRKAIDIGDYAGDHARIQRELGWQARQSLEVGLVRTMEHYLSNPNAYLRPT